MSKFAIEFRRDSPNDAFIQNAQGHAIGDIRLGSFIENFQSNLTFWNRGDYQRHWRDGLSRLLAGADRSALLTNVSDPLSANFFTWWTAYKIKEVIIFHNGLLFLDQLSEPFDIERVHDYVPPYTNTSDNGDSISEWQMSIRGIWEFVGQMPIE